MTTMKKSYITPSITVTDLKLDSIVCTSVTGSIDSNVDIKNGGGSEGNATEGEVKPWGGNIFDENE